MLSQFLNFKRKTPQKPTTQPTPPKDSPFELIRQAMLEARQQARQGGPGSSPVLGRQNPQRSAPVTREFPMQVPFSSGEHLQMPPAIQPESSFLPTLLLIALAVCLLAMAYMRWAS